MGGGGCSRRGAGSDGSDGSAGSGGGIGGGSVGSAGTGGAGIVVGVCSADSVGSGVGTASHQRDSEADMSDHTPGPWRVVTDGIRHWVEIDGLISIVMNWYGKQAVANARLIADAPRLYDENKRLREVNAELLEALKEAVDIVDGAISDRSTGDMDSFTLQPARAAIIKATEVQS